MSDLNLFVTTKASDRGHDPHIVITPEIARRIVAMGLPKGDAPSPTKDAPVQLLATTDRVAGVMPTADDYLALGGLFNPEAMEHDKVRDLIIRQRDDIATLRTKLGQAEGNLLAERAGYQSIRQEWATHRCKVCGALWHRFNNGHWTLCSLKCGACCDNAAMGEQIEPIGLTAELAKAQAERDEAQGLIHDAETNCGHALAERDAAVKRAEAISAHQIQCREERDAAQRRVKVLEGLLGEARHYVVRDYEDPGLVDRIDAALAGARA